MMKVMGLFAFRRVSGAIPSLPRRFIQNTSVSQPSASRDMIDKRDQR
ncbi:hypothetical protein [Burkholderia plantarii]|nr:hypothetical protein [Burkholderia plantarii]MBI0327887.1 hypothetical protein [Burkholderia plantarii]